MRTSIDVLNRRLRGFPQILAGNAKAFSKVDASALCTNARARLTVKRTSA
jgi:hypothetical protein